MHLLSDTKLAFSIGSAAEATEMTAATIQQAIDSGELRTFRAGNKKLISRLSLEHWIYRQEVAAAHEGRRYEGRRYE